MSSRTAQAFKLGDELTLRELEIVELIATGASSAEIGRRLFVSAETVKAHLWHIGLKTGRGSRAGIVGFAIRAGLMPVPVTGTPPTGWDRRHFEVLVRIARGLSNEEIAADLGSSTETVKSQVRRLLLLLGVRTRQEAVVAGFRCGVLSLVPRQRVAS